MAEEGKPETLAPEAETAPQESFVVEMSDDNIPQTIEADTDPVAPNTDNSGEDGEDLGKRAQKRIRGLVSKSKEQEGTLASQQAELDKLRAENKTLKAGKQTSEVQNVDSHIKRVEAERLAAEKDYRDATAVEDTDKQLTAMRRLQQAETQTMALNARKHQMEHEAANEPDEPEAEVPATTSPAVQDERTEDWVEKNPWIKSLQDPAGSAEDQEMARFAGRLHNYATEVRQLDPVTDADEYWKQIDDGLKSEFPERFNPDQGGAEESKPAATRQVSANPRRPSRAKRKVKLTTEQMAFAKRYKISTEEMAKQQAALDARKGE